MLFKQLYDTESSTLTYIIADSSSKEAAIIDPVKSQIETYKTLISEYGLTLKYSLETHVHADHITASGLLRQQLGCITGVSKACGAKYADIQIKDRDAFHLGKNETIVAIATPGHTMGSLSFMWRDKVFTGDALLINGCGRTDFQGGDAGDLYDSITQRLFNLPDETLVFPGHDYKNHRVSSIGQEKLINPRLANKCREQFIEFMNNLNLPKPNLIDIAVPANRYCGLDEEEAIQSSEPKDEVKPSQLMTPSQMVAQIKHQIKEITINETSKLIQNKDVVLIDIREQNEFEQGSITGALFIPRGILEFKISEFSKLHNPETKLVLFCRSGNRSALAAVSLQNMGFKNVMSMIGGYETWKAQENKKL